MWNSPAALLFRGIYWELEFQHKSPTPQGWWISLAFPLWAGQQPKKITFEFWWVSRANSYDITYEIASVCIGIGGINLILKQSQTQIISSLSLPLILYSLSQVNLLTIAEDLCKWSLKIPTVVNFFKFIWGFSLIFLYCFYLLHLFFWPLWLTNIIFIYEIQS
jgi:hypothetical protein